MDNESAYEIINAEREALLQDEIAAAKEQQKKAADEAKGKEGIHGRKKEKTAAERMADKAMNTIGREIGKSISRGLLGSLKKFMGDRKRHNPKPHSPIYRIKLGVRL